MTTAPSPPAGEPTPRDRLKARVRKILCDPGARKMRGPDADEAVWLVMADADAYAAWMAEQIARPDDRWGPP
jgi:hypothetical protein